MNKHVINAAKFLFVAALLYWVFSSIQWQDCHVQVDAAGEEIPPRVAGKILGAWDRPEVRFVTDGQTEDETLKRTATLRILPGLWTYAKNLHPGWFLLGVMCYVLSVFFAATRWWWLLRVNDLPVGYWAAVRFSWIGIFFNNVVPGQTGGDLVKAIYVMKRCEGARVPAMMSVVVDRIMGLGSLALLAAIAVLFYLDNADFKAIAIILWAILAAVVLGGVVAFSKRLRNMIRLTAMLERLPEKLSHLLKRIDHAVYFYRSHKGGMVLWLFAGMFNHCSSVMSYAVVGYALGVGVPLQDYFVLIPIIVIVSALPIAPNGWGLGEWMFQSVFGEFGARYLPAAGTQAAQIMGTRGVALSLVYRIMLTLMSSVGGLLFFFDKDKVTREDMAREVAEEEREEAKMEEEMAVD